MATFSERQLTTLLAAIVLVGACGGGSSAPPPDNTTPTVAAVSGNAQNGIVGQVLANPIAVAVTEGGQPAAAVTVEWSTGAANAAVTPTSVASDANGIANSRWTLGTVSGSQAAQATVSGAIGSPVTFSATAAPDAATTLARAGGDAQSGVINTQLAAQVQAKVTDRFGNGVPAVDVGWAAAGGAVSAGTVATDATGTSGVSVTLGGTAGRITITATSGTLTGSPLTFTANATAGPTIAIVSVVNTSFSPSAITVAAGTTVVWIWSSAARQHNVVPVATLPTGSGTPADGPHTYQFKFDTPGTYRYYCAVHGSPGSGMSGTVTVQ